MLECVVNLSEGRDHDRLSALAEAAGGDLLDVHIDPDHHRSVLTMVGEDAPRAVAARAIELLDIQTHEGAHPRLGVVDVVPFVPLEGSTMAQALDARDAFAAWLANEYEVPCFLYGPERSLPDVRRHAFRQLEPDQGPAALHPTAGATCVGARPVLVAYNLWLTGTGLADAQFIAASIRRPGLRALGLAVGGSVQISMNLIDPTQLDPSDAFDLVQAELAGTGGEIARAELVGLVPEATIQRIPRARLGALDLSEDRTIESRLRALGRA